MKELIKQIRELRAVTGLGILPCKEALEQAGYDFAKAKEIALAKAAEKIRPEALAKHGYIDTYTHNGRIAAMILLTCETDFVANTVEFRGLAHELAMQVASMNPTDVNELLIQRYVRDGSKTVAELISDCAARCNESITVARFARLEV